MISLDQALIFSAAAFLLLVTPGPSVLYVTTRTISGGARAGALSTFGLACGDFLQVVAVVAGLATVVASSPAALQILKLAGAAYLGYLAYKCLSAPSRIEPTDAGTPSHPDHDGVFRQAVLVNALNPKSLLFFVAFLPGFVDAARGPAWTQGLALGTLFVLIGIVTNGSWAAASCLARGQVLAKGDSIFARKYLPAGIFLVLAVMTLLSV